MYSYSYQAQLVTVSPFNITLHTTMHTHLPTPGQHQISKSAPTNYVGDGDGDDENGDDKGWPDKAEEP